MDANKCQTSGTSSNPSSIALSAQKANNVPTCLNCSKPSHMHPYCISPEGGMEGKLLEDMQKKRRLDKEAVRAKSETGTSNSSQKIWIPYKDANSQALILEVNASAITATPLPNLSSNSFAGIASIHTDDITGIESIHNSSTLTESLELEGWMATYDIKDLPETTLPSVPITPNDFALSAVAQSSVGFEMIDTIPFKIDSGASAPISPMRGNFVNYQAITPHGVKGLGGVVVKAVGVRNIIIHQS